MPAAFVLTLDEKTDVIANSRHHDISDDYVQSSRRSAFDRILHELEIDLREFGDQKYFRSMNMCRDFIYSKDEIKRNEETSLKVELYASKLAFLKDIRCNQLIGGVQKIVNDSNINFSVEYNMIPMCGKDYIETGQIPNCHMEFHGYSSVPDIDDMDNDFAEHRFGVFVEHIANVVISKVLISWKVFPLVLRRLTGLRKEEIDTISIKIVDLVMEHSGNITSSIISDKVEMMVSKYRNELTLKNMRENRFKSFQLKLLENAILIRCPLISSKILPLGNLGPEYQRIIANFTNPINSNCEQHVTICLEWAVSEIVCEFRSQECKQALDEEIAKDIPAFKFEMLSTLPAIHRYKNSTRLGMWVNIHFNGPKIIREEGLGRVLEELGINLSNLSPESNSIFVDYVLSEDSSEIILEKNGWPVTQNCIFCSHKILELEALRMKRHESAMSLLKSLFMFKSFQEAAEDDTLFLIVTEWIQFENSPITELKTALSRHQYDIMLHHCVVEVGKRLVDQKSFNAMFFSDGDALNFTKTNIFRLLCLSVESFRKFVICSSRDPAIHNLLENVMETVQKYIQQDISREAVLTVATQLDWDD